MMLKVMLAGMVLLAGAVEAAPAGGAKKATAKKAAVQKAKAPKARAKTKGAAPAAGPVQTAHRKDPYVGALAADASGRILFEDRADAEAYPASCTKLMTILLVLEDVRAGKYGLDDLVTATPEVNRCQASWVGIKVGETMSVRDLCRALMVESANDAAILLGVKSAGSLSGFVARMNARAAELGMTKTAYYNPNGLPAPKFAKSFNVSTARDQLKLALAFAKLPEIYEFTSIKTCDLVKRPGGYRTEVTRRVNEPFHETQLAAGESVVKQLRNHNNVMRTDKLKIINPDGKEAVDGLKTGYIDAGGSSVVITGTRGGKRAFVVVLGSATAKLRDAHAQRLLIDALGRL